ncbi:YafY family protein [Metabacillus sp. FJAT-52054]|uniref:YafY family protein n=1 Tax=Metabacillus sediminis TaxID=3117746 RepID=A0ABZ2NGK0_9BACI
MNRSKRLYDLLTYINRRDSFTARECSEEFGVSIRTIQRDLEELSTWGVPFYSEQGRHGGYRMLNKNLLPPILFSADEAVSIYFAYQSLFYFRSLPFQIDIESALQKFYSNLPQHSKEKLDRLKDTITFWSPLSHLAEAPYLQEIADAAIEKQIVEWLYDSKGGQNKREVVPIGIYAHGGLWYVPAYLIEKEKISLFRADRVLGITRKGKKMEGLPTLTEWFLQDDTAQSNSMLDIRLSREGVRLCKNHPILQTGLSEEEDGSGFIRRQMDPAEISYTATLLLSLGGNAEVLKPETLRKEMKEHARVLVDLYADVEKQ